MFAWRHPILKTPNLGRPRARSVLFDLKDTRDLINSLVMHRYATAFRLPPMGRKLLGSGETPSLRVTPVGDLMCWGGGDEPERDQGGDGPQVPGSHDRLAPGDVAIRRSLNPQVAEFWKWA